MTTPSTSDTTTTTHTAAAADDRRTTPTRRYVEPGWATRRLMNPLVAWLTRRGVPMKGAAVLEVTGRRSGEPRRTPVNPLELDGRTYLVSPRGDTEWSRNVRAAGVAELITGRRHRTVEVGEVPASDQVRVLRAYLDEWGWEVGRFLPTLGKGATDAEYAAAVPAVPMFLVAERVVG